MCKILNFDPIAVGLWETLNMKVIVDEIIFPEWVKSINFNVIIFGYSLWKLDPKSNLDWEVSRS